MAVESSALNPLYSTSTLPPLSIIEHGTNNREKIFLMTGWPDDQRCMDPIVARFKDSHHLMVACMPDYDRPALNPSYKWGYDYDIIVGMIHEAITSRTTPNERVTIIAHDFGATMTCLYAHAHPEKVKRLVNLDVAWPNTTYGVVEGFTNMAFLMPYMVMNAFQFMVYALLSSFHVFDFVSWLLMLFNMIYMALFGPVFGWPLFQGIYY